MNNKQWDKFHHEIQMETAVDKDYKNFLSRFYHDDKEKRSVIDIGCGQGSAIAYTSYYYKDWIVHGIDFSWKALCKVNHRMLGRKNVKLKQCSADNIDYPNEKFDMVSINVLLASIENPEGVIKEAYRILKPHGKVFLKELSDSPCNIDNKYIRRGKEAKKYSEQYLYNLLNDNGFDKVKTYKSELKEQNVEHIVVIGRKK